MINIKLDEEQSLAANTKEGHYLVLSGAGTGKTRVLTARSCFLIEAGVPEDEILCITYTKKAKNEMEKRISELMGRQTAVNVKTFHSFCFENVSMFRANAKKINVITEEDRKDILRKIIKRLKYNPLLNDKETSLFISHMKNQMYYKNRGFTRNQMFKMMRIYYEYEEYCKVNNLLDFDQMISECLEHLKHHPDQAQNIANNFRYIMVDECQDMNRTQYEILQILEKGHHNLFLVGDQDQTIYEWRGSDQKLMNEFVDTYNPNILMLSNNYRCDGYAVEIGDRVISNNSNRFDTHLQAVKPKKNKPQIYGYIYPTEEAYAVAKMIKEFLKNGLALKDIKVLYREKKQLSFFEAAFRSAKITYETNAITLIEIKYIKNLIKYLRFLINNNDELLLEIINYPTRGIGLAKVNEIIQIASKNKISRFDACRLIDDKKVQAFVELIDGLRLTMKSLAPKEFINYLINVTNYEKVIEKEPNEKLARVRLESFLNMIYSFEIETDDYVSETSRMINELLLENSKEKLDDNTVKIMTVHQAKGLEAKVIFLVGMRQGTFPFSTNSIDELEAERRLCYGAQRL